MASLPIVLKPARVMSSVQGEMAEEEDPPVTLLQALDNEEPVPEQEEPESAAPARSVPTAAELERTEAAAHYYGVFCIAQPWLCLGVTNSRCAFQLFNKNCPSDAREITCRHPCAVKRTFELVRQSTVLAIPPLFCSMLQH